MQHRLFLAAVLLLVPSCVPPAVPDPNTALTAGVVQREIRTGMSQAEVAEALGSPNIVSRDDDANEVWIYDRIATYATTSTHGGSLGGGGGASAVRGNSLILGILSGAFGANSSTTATEQRTLTVILKFDREQRLKTFSYHQSHF